MTTRPNIIITGFMGTGKTTVGKLLAKQLDYDFVDTDELIVTRSGQTVEEIFQEKGEETFREMEAAVAQELGGKEGLVISTGGRTMLDPKNATALSKGGRVFCLVATPEEIMERLEAEYQRQSMELTAALEDRIRQYGPRSFVAIELKKASLAILQSHLARVEEARYRTELQLETGCHVELICPASSGVDYKDTKVLEMRP